MELKILILRSEQIESAAGFHTQGNFIVNMLSYVYWIVHHLDS